MITLLQDIPDDVAGSQRASSGFARLGAAAIAAALVVGGCSGRDEAEQPTTSYIPNPVVSGSLRVAVTPRIIRPAPAVLPQSGSMARTAAIGPGDQVAYIDDWGSQVKLGDLGDSTTLLVGRTGAGPGEYNRATRIASCGDAGFVVADIGNNRLLYF